jgi:NitT/TauT family transport system substrate-binding protein
VHQDVGSIVLDVRRGDGPKPCFNNTMASLAATDRLLAALPQTRPPRSGPSPTHAALKDDLAFATTVGRKPQTLVTGMNAFARDLGTLQGDVVYEQIVAPQLRFAAG